MSDEKIQGVLDDYTIPVEPSEPVITADQFNTIYELIGKEPVTSTTATGSTP
jgi:hypothetical protein